MFASTLRLTTLAVATIVSVAASASSAAAQQLRVPSSDAQALPTVTTTSSPKSVTPAPLGPRNATAGIDTRAAADSASPLVPQEGSHIGAGTNLALMGAGAAAVIVGLMIGGDGGTIVAISGGILGLVGLFRYIR